MLLKDGSVNFGFYSKKFDIATKIQTHEIYSQQKHKKFIPLNLIHCIVEQAPGLTLCEQFTDPCNTLKAIHNGSFANFNVAKSSHANTVAGNLNHRTIIAI